MPMYTKKEFLIDVQEKYHIISTEIYFSVIYITIKDNCILIIKCKSLSYTSVIVTLYRVSKMY